MHDLIVQGLAVKHIIVADEDAEQGRVAWGTHIEWFLKAG
jgi:hypothetical protein